MSWSMCNIVACEEVVVGPFVGLVSLPSSLRLEHCLLHQAATMHITIRLVDACVRVRVFLFTLWSGIS